MHEDGERPTAPGDTQTPRRRLGWWSVLLLIQFVAVLWPPFFNRADPSWLGIPFFYWYQLAWVILGAGCTLIVYLATDE